MNRRFAFAPMTFAIVLSLAALSSTVAGCKKDPADEPAAPDVSAEVEAVDALAGLSAEDRAAVLAQKICPVTGEALGSMGAPIKITVEGRDVFICCAGCEDLLKADPAKYFAILDKAAGSDAAEGEAADEPAEADDAVEDEPAGG